MPAKKAGYSVRMWLSQQEIADVKATADKTGLSQVEVMSRIMSAGIQCVREYGYKLTLPLEFQIVEEADEEPRNITLNERGKKK